MEEAPPAPPKFSQLSDKFHEYKMYMEALISKAKPYTIYRWIITGILTIIFYVKMFHSGNYYAIGYICGLLLINWLIMFVSPKNDPALKEDTLPAGDDDDYKPFVSQLPEFLFWERVTLTIVITWILSFFSFINLPVNGPLLFIYLAFVLLFSFRARIAHMIKYKYVPWNTGKKKASKTASQ